MSENSLNKFEVLMGKKWTKNLSSMWLLLSKINIVRINVLDLVSSTHRSLCSLYSDADTKLHVSTMLPRYANWREFGIGTEVKTIKNPLTPSTRPETWMTGLSDALQF